MAMRTTAAVEFVLLAGLMSASADDWPNWRGPEHNGISREALPDDLSSAAVDWRAEVGTGFATVSVAGERVVTVGNCDGRDIVRCLADATGETIWEHRYACALDPRYYEGGPGGTPTIDRAAGAVYTLSKKGHALCLDLEGGEVRWSRDLRKEYGLELPEWSFACSPVVAGNVLLLNVGSAGLALDKASGETRWRSGKTRSGYASAVPVGEGAHLIFSAKELLAVDSSSGDKLWRFPWESSRDINAADPIVDGSEVFISSSSGCALLEAPSERGAAAEVRWKNRNLRTYFNPGVLVDRHVYAIHGTTHGPTELVCIDWDTGKTVWAEGGFGSGALMASGGGEELILFDKGQLTVCAASEEGFVPRLQMQVLGGKCWTAPVLANGRIYCRNAKGQLACVSVR